VAKATDIGVAPDEPFAIAGARIVRTRSDELFAHAAGVLDTGDIERVHDMRVASRRLRAALEIFAVCFPAADHRRVLRDVKALAGALGERRDPDVHIEAMERFAVAVDPGYGPGVEALVDRLRARQAGGNAALAAALTRAGETDLHGRLHALALHAEGTA
jgi:CHAD domain-containing protein